MLSLSSVILTYNEEKHLKRLLTSIDDLCAQINIIDSYSTDNTKQIALQEKCNFYEHKWSNYAKQFNWGLEKAKDNCKHGYVFCIAREELFHDFLFLFFNYLFKFCCERTLNWKRLY